MTQAMSPMLPINSQPMSPSMSSNLNSANNLMPSGSELRYSPLSPHYNNSPIRGYSPSSNRHYSGMSPSYSYNSPSSPNYSPNTSGKFFAIILNQYRFSKLEWSEQWKFSAHPSKSIRRFQTNI
jgi:hypothetical protein